MGEIFRRYQDVPAGSTVEVEVSPCDGKVATKAKLIRSDGVDTWDPCLNPNPTTTLRKGKRYFISVLLGFQQSATVTLVVRVRTPGGGVHSSPWTWTVTGKKGDIKFHGGFIERVI